MKIAVALVSDGIKGAKHHALVLLVGDVSLLLHDENGADDKECEERQLPDELFSVHVRGQMSKMMLKLAPTLVSPYLP